MRLCGAARTGPATPAKRTVVVHPPGAAVSGGHAHALHLERDSALHRLAPETKIAATVAFVLMVVATPREAVWAYGAHAALLAAAATAGRIPAGFMARRMVIELPFVAFALALPLVGQGPQTTVLGVGLSVEGLWAGWNILVKGTLGVGATVLLAATTPVADLLRGLERLRVPRALTLIATFMVRYAEVIVAELRRMRLARLSRGDDPRWLWQARGVAATSGALFVRSYERGERVHLAMLARGWNGVLPDSTRRARPVQWATALLLPVAAAGVCVAARVNPGAWAL